MSKTISETLKEATNGILTEDVLKDIESLFESTVAAKARLQVENALILQDEDYSKKLETLINAIDVDHVKKLNKVVEAIDRKRTSQLKMVVEKYERHIGAEAKNFQNILIENISNYLTAYIDEKIPTETIEEAVNNKNAQMVLDEIRTKLGVNMAFATETIREAVKDGKTTIDDLRTEVTNLRAENMLLTESNAVNNAKLLVESKISEFASEKKSRVRKMVADKDSKYITENCDYIINLVEKNEEAHLEALREEAIKDSTANNVDRQIVSESTEEKENKTPEHELTKVYMTELVKW